MKLISCTLLCLLLAFGIPVASAERESPAIESIQADFTQEKHLKILQKPLISTGTFIFAAPDSLRWEYRTPIPSVLLMHDGTIQKYIQQNGKFVAGRGMRLDSMQVILTEIGNWLDGRFSGNDMFTASFPSKNTVLLEPKDPALAGLISRIELKLAEQRGLLDSVTITEGPQSSTTMTFTNRVLNQDIPASAFIAE